MREVRLCLNIIKARDSNYYLKDNMSQKLTDAMSKLNVEGSRASMVLGRHPSSPGNKRNSGLDASTINSMFPDAAAAIAKQKAEFTQHTGALATSNRNSMAFGDRTSSLMAPSLPPTDEVKKENQQSTNPWPERGSDAQSSAFRPKSSSGFQPMGQFSQPPTSNPRSPRPSPLGGDNNLQNTILNAPDGASGGLPVLSPYNGSGNWASMVNTPMVSNFPNQQSATQAEMVANATAMKLAALSTVNNRIQLDDVKKYRRARSSEGQNTQNPLSPGLPGSNIPGTNIVMTNELGQVLTQQQLVQLQAQQSAALSGRRSRPSSPAFAMHNANFSAMNFASPQNNGFLAAYDVASPLPSNTVPGINLSQYGAGMTGGNEGYMSDHSEMNRGRSPRGRRGTSKPPEDPTDPALLQDIPSWLRSLRLHKYTDNLKDLSWQDLVELDDAGLEKRGVNALGARRKMLKVSCCVRT